MKNENIDIVKEELKESIILSPLYADKSVTGKEIYHESLTKALIDNDIKNIAITGPYGSGKSSVIESFVENNQDKNKFLKISLANFISDNNNPELEKEIESSILQQLYYQIPNEKIPYSRFNKIENLEKWKLIKISITTALWIISSIYLIINKPFTFDFVSAFSFTSYTKIVWTNFIINLFFITGLFCFIRFFVILIKKGKISKLNLKSNSIELRAGSIINKHLDELIYFFEVTKYTVVFIEDLDRFDKVELFEKLREINFILNQSPDIKDKIKFVYAIRDDVFKTNEDRTKFFDLIIPIVPVMDSSNSNEKLKKLFTDCGYAKIPVDEQFVNDVSLYIYDLRLLKNVVNEFTVYNKQINTENHSKEVSFSLILFKNLYPEEFNKLHQKSGFLFDIFNKHKNILKNEIINSLKEKQRKVNDELNPIKEEETNDIKKLRAEYIEKILSEQSNVMVNGFQINNDILSKEEIVENNNFNEFIKKPQISITNYISRGGSYYSKQEIKSDIDFTDIEKKINRKYTYKEREANITKKSNQRLTSLTTLELSLMRKLDEVKLMSLKALIKESDTDEKLAELFMNIPSDTKNNTHNDPNNTHNKSLIMFLLRKGYISEEYNSYISYPDSLTPNDKSFLLNIKNETKANIDTDIDDVNLVINRLSIDDYKSIGLYNYEFIYYLINSNHTLEIKTFFSEFKFDNQKIIDFAFKFIAKYDNKKGIKTLLIFINHMVQNFTKIWLYIDVNQVYDEENKKRFLQLLLLSIQDSKIIKKVDVDSDMLLSNYILSLEDFFQLFPNQTPIEKHLDELMIFFDKVTIDTNTQHSLVDHIYKNLYFDRNENMVLQLIQYKNNNNKKEEIKKQFYSQNYTCIMDSECDELIEYINTDIDIYIDGLYLELNNIQEENQEEYLKLLNSNLSVEYKENILTKNKTKITNIALLEEHKLYEAILIQGKMEVSWQNVFTYFKEKNSVIDPILLEFINNTKNAELLSFADMQLISPEESSEIAYSILYNSQIQIETFEKLYDNETFQLVFEDGFVIESIDEKKLKYLIRKDTSLYTIEYYNQIKKSYYNYHLHIELIENNFVSFFNTEDDDYPSYKEFDLDVTDFLLLIVSEKISLSNKEKIIKIIPVELLKDIKLADTILKFIIKNNFYDISFEIAKEILKNGTENNKKISLVYHLENTIERTELSALIRLLPLGFANIFIHKARVPKIISNKLNNAFTKMLYEQKFIRKYEIKEGNIYIWKKR